MNDSDAIVDVDDERLESVGREEEEIYRALSNEVQERETGT